MSDTPYVCETYQDLIVMLLGMTPEQLNCTPTLYDPDMDEYYPCKKLKTIDDTNCVLDKNHPYLCY